MTRAAQAPGQALVALGTSLPFGALAGEALLRAALDALAERGLATRALSRFFVTEAWPDLDDPEFTNAVALLDAGARTPEAVLADLQAVEHAFGRVRGGKPYMPRTLDLDLLDLDRRVQEGAVTLPHPRMHERYFVLAPLCDIAPDWVHPVLGLPAREILRTLNARN